MNTPSASSGGRMDGAMYAGPQDEAAARPRPDGGGGMCLWLGGLLLLPLVLLGVGLCYEHMREVRRSARSRQLAAVEHIAGHMPYALARRLTFTPADRDLHACRELAGRLRVMGQFVEHRSIYTLRLRDGEWFFGPESLDESDPMHSPVGTLYRKPPPELWVAQESGMPVLTEPFTDEYGSFVSAFAPVQDPDTGETLMLVGLDLDSRVWRMQAWRKTFPFVLGLPLPATMMLAICVLLRRRQRRSGRRTSYMGCCEAAFVIVMGLSLTFYVTVTVVRTDQLRQRKRFMQLLNAQRDNLCARLTLAQQTLSTLAYHIGRAPDMTHTEFELLAEHLSDSMSFGALAWIVLDEQEEARLRYEARQPAWTPQTSREEAWLGKERRDALMHTLESGLPAVSDPVPRDIPSGETFCLTLFHPAHREDLPPGGAGPAVQAVAAMKLCARQLLGPVREAAPDERLTPHMRLLMMDRQRQWRVLGADPASFGEHDPEMPLPGEESFRHPGPLFLFDVPFLLYMEPAPAFVRLHASRAGWMAAGGGVLLAGLLALLLGFLRWRQRELEHASQTHWRELEERERSLAVTLQSIADGVIAVDVKGRIERMNRQAERLSGLRFEDVQGKQIDEVFRFVSTRTRKKVENPVGLVLQQGRGLLQQSPLSLVTTHGVQCQVALNAAPVTDDQGLVQGVVMVLSDVSEKFSAERHLRQSEARFRDVAEASGEYIWEIDQGGRITYVSDRATDVLGFPLQHIVGRALYDFMPAEEVDSVRGQIEAARATLKPFRAIEHRVARADGTIIWLRINGVPFFGPTGEIAGYRGTGLDITARREAQDDLLRTSEELRHVFELTPDLLFIARPDGSLVRCNQAWQRLLGIDPRSIEGGDGFRQLTHPDDLSATDSAFEQLHRTGTLDGFTNRLVLKGGSHLWVSWSARQYRDLIYGVGRDITGEIRRQEELSAASLRFQQELITLNAQLEEAITRANSMAAEAEVANHTKGIFMAELNREVNTPLHGILEATGVLDAARPSPLQRRYLDVVRAGAQSVLALVENTCDLAVGQSEPSAAISVVRTLLEDVGDILVWCARERGLDLVVEHYAESPEQVRGDASRMCQILLALGGGVLSQAQGAGEVSLRARCLNMNPDGALMRFEVYAPAGVLPEGTVAGLFGGDGPDHLAGGEEVAQGVAMARRLAAGMDGHLGAEQDGDGAHRLWLELRLPPAVEATQESWQVGGRFLLLASSSGHARALRSLLACAGGGTETATFARDALRRLEEAHNRDEPFDMIFAEQALPDMTGEQFGRVVAVDERFRHMPLVRLLPLDQPYDAVVHEKSVFHYFLHLPVRHGQVHHVLRHWRRNPPDREEPLDAGTGAVRESAQRARLRILLAEDAPLAQSGTLDVLGPLGYPVHVVHTGKDVLRTMREMNFDLILMDLHMPELDACQVAQAMHEREQAKHTPHIPLVVLAAEFSDQDRRRCREAGVDGFLEKPIQSEALEALLKPRSN